MAIKELQTRIALKYDSYSAWTSAPGKDLVLLAGELGICHVGDANADTHVVPTVLFKVGDGTSTFEQLPWASAKAADVYAWAKASDVTVVYNEDGTKAIKFVGGAVDAEGKKIDKLVPVNFATPEEVKTITDVLASKISALEAKFPGEGSVSALIATAKQEAIDAAATDATNKADAAEAAAKDYTDEVIGDKANGDVAATGIRKEIADAEAAAKSYTDGIVATEKSDREAADSALGERIDAIVKADTGTIATGDKATLEAAKTYAKDYADGLADNYDAAGSAATAEANAKKHADDEIKKAVDNQATVDANQNAEIAKKLDITTYEGYIAGKSLSDAELKTYADGKASEAQGAAISAAAKDATDKVNALADGAVATNAANISAMDTAYKAADTEIKGRLDTVEGKLANVTNVMDFRGAVAALPETTDGYQNGDVIVVTDGDNKGKEYVVSDGAFVEFGNTDANAAAISDLQGRMSTAESDIDAAEKDIDDLQAAVATKLAAETFNTWKGTHENDHAKTATEITSEITTAVNGEKSRAEAAEKAINDKIGTLPSDYTTLVAGIKTAKDQADKGVSDAAAVAGRMTTAEGEIDALQAASHTHTNKDELDLIASGDKTKWDEAYNKRHEHANKAELDLIASGDKAKWDTAATNAGNAVADLAALTGEGGRLTVAEGNITTIQGIVNSGAGKTIRDDVTALQTLIGDASKGNEALRSELTTLQGIVNNENTGLVATKKIADAAKKASEDNDAAIKAIQADYLKAADQYIFNCGSSITVVHEKAAN